jgi:hypothetical protein
LGAYGGSSFSNLFVGPSFALEVPATKHFEFDLKDTFSPIEQHIALGKGYANQVNAGGIVWLNKSIGLDGSAEYSYYHVSIAKYGEYARGGVVLRKSIQGMPMRYTFNYVREFHNGIFPNNATGTETPHLQAGEFDLDMRVKCAGPFCYRLQFDFMVGHVLTQGNPLCDGTLGNTGGNGPNGSCPRGSATSGSFTGGLYLEWPRHRDTESNAF